jgi:hypothetical protein
MLSALLLYPLGNIPCTHFCYMLRLPQDHDYDTIGYRTRDLQACSEVPGPTAPPRAPHLTSTTFESPSTRNLPTAHVLVDHCGKLSTESGSSTTSSSKYQLNRNISQISNPSISNVHPLPGDTHSHTHNSTN